MRTYKVIKDGKTYGYIFGEDINDAVAKAKWTMPWVNHSHLKQVKYK
tara:strand:- start:4800 stop:4940 length:141 start_codon:yes stop_codon:yes gene_type:complete